MPAGNRNPQIAWSSPPAGTKSLILLCTDHDVPADFSSANKEGCTIPADAPRTDFHHWVLVDISPEESCIDPGTLSKGFVTHGKKGPACANGMRQGLNDYTKAFADDPEVRGKYYGYDGPCPPWNDLRPHGYVFTLYAVDFPLLPLSGPFTAEDVLRSHERPYPCLRLRYRDVFLKSGDSKQTLSNQLFKKPSTQCLGFFVFLRLRSQGYLF